MVGLTAEELLARHTEKDWRRKFVDVSDLLDVLRDCIIDDDYAVPDDLKEALPLSARGNEIKSRLIRREQVPAKEAHLMCALTLGHDELLVDIHGIEVDALQASISRQILDREIRFPLVFGRAFYDAYASLFDEEKVLVSTDETQKLLNLVPPGVFQYGRFVVGPSGLNTSDHSRSLRFSKRVPAYHCNDPVCRELHPVVLSTSQKAPINAQRQKLTVLLDGESAAQADWVGLAAEVSRQRESHFGNHWVAPMITLLGDCLGYTELALLLDTVENTPLAQRDSEAWLDEGDNWRADALERALAHSDQVLASTLDHLVHRREIRVPRGEVRSPVTTAHLRSGALRLRPQLGYDGVRFVSGDPGLPTLRERDLIRKIYLAGSTEERHELDWQLRGVDGVSIEVRLDEYLRTAPPAEALTRLVLSRSTSAIAASELAGIGDLDGADDGQIISRLIWKLGFREEHVEDDHDAFWRLHERLAAAVQTWLGTGPGDDDEFKGLASAYFSQLEGVLQEALGFAAWSLLHDHTSSKRPFTYDNDDDLKNGHSLLHDAYKSLVTPLPGESLSFAGRLTMYKLVRGFAVLSDALRAIEQKREDYARPRDQFPDFARTAALQRFPFSSTAPFLDLAEHSRTRIVEGLSEVSTALQDGNTSNVRNDYSHYRRTSPEVVSMARTLEHVGRAVRLIENLGFGLNLCSPSGESVDQWGRKTVQFVGPRSVSHQISRPSSLQWVGLPSLRQPQYLVRAAAFDDANEVLRFTRRYSSEFSSMWAGYPAPRTVPAPPVDGSVSVSESSD